MVGLLGIQVGGYVTHSVDGLKEVIIIQNRGNKRDAVTKYRKICAKTLLVLYFIIVSGTFISPLPKPFSKPY